MIRVYGYVLLNLHIINALENCEPVTNADDPHLLQFFVP